MNTRLPSWFWLLLCIASFAGSAFAWHLERPNKAQPLPQQAVVEVQAEADVEPSPTTTPDAAIEPTAVDTMRALPPRPATPTFGGTVTGDSSAATKVLRCVIRGRVTYVDAATTCADGSSGKLTVLPR